MLLSTSNQAYIFLTTVYAGIIIGFLYDCCRMIRKMIRAGVIVTGILDLLFWAIIGLISFMVLFYINDGKVRIYTLIGFALGWILYILTLSPFIMKSLNWIYEIMAKIIQWLMKILLWPFRILKRSLVRAFIWLKKLIGRCKNGCKNNFSRISQVILKKTDKKIKE